METDETKQFAICQNGHEMRATPELFPAPIGKLLGFTIVGDEEGKAAIEFEATENHANPMGTLHGGVLCDLGGRPKSSFDAAPLFASKAIPALR